MSRYLIPLLLVACGDNRPAAPDAQTAALDGSCKGRPDQPNVLVFSAENLWNHTSNPIAQGVLLDMCQTRGFNVVATRDPVAFHDGHLDTTDVVVFAMTSGPVLDDDGRAAFEAWLTSGHGMVGFHSASATELEFPFFIQSLGAQFRGHPGGGFKQGTLVTSQDHPITAGYPARQVRTDEWYTFWTHPEADPNTHVVAWLDESTLPADYPTDLLMGQHAIAWTHEGFGGRSFYTAIGHRDDTYVEQPFLDLLANAIVWAAGR